VRPCCDTSLPIASLAAPLYAVAAAAGWHLNPVLSFLGVYFAAIAVAVPTAALAAFTRWRGRRGAGSPPRQRLVDASIWMVAAGAALGWVMLAMVVFGVGDRLRIGLKNDSFLIGLAFVPPVLALASGPMALAGRGRGRGIVLGGFGLMVLAIVALVVAANQQYTGPPPSF